MTRPRVETSPVDRDLDIVVEMVREISLQTDPQAMISVFRKRTRLLYGGDGSISLSRRGLQQPAYRITRSTRWKEDLNPWTQTDQLPLLKGGLLADLIYNDQARIIRDVTVSDCDPAYDYLRNVRSMVSLPLYDGGEALNMVIRLSREADGFDNLNLAEAIMTANLFGRATSNLVVAKRLQEAHDEIDHEMKQIAALQRSLLPERLPRIPGLDIAASYKTAARAGGDYYDFFDLGDGRWGLWIADVSGHGARAAVVMAMLRTLLHARCQQHCCPAELLALANRSLCEQSDRYDSGFVTAFYGVYDPADRTLRYVSAGHNPPLLVDRATRVRELDETQTLPLGVDSGCTFDLAQTSLSAGDTLLLYTDGITEATNEHGEMYGRDRLLSCVCEDVPNAQHIIDCVTHKLLGFTHGGVQSDDQTLVALRVQ